MSISIINELKKDFEVYAEEVNNQRAFPDVRDGLKPGQRAALWEMYTKGYSSTKPHVKSAKVSGGTIAMWWPHGDVGVYDSICRMSQNWVNNMPEVDFHGGNGSVIGGPQCSSSRYTECRLASLSEDGLFSNIKKDTVNFIQNFSEDAEWPEVLPAIMPRLYVNGSQGIGYTIAQEWEPGNLKEFTAAVKSYVKTGKVDCSTIFPDYPTGGIIVNKDEIKTLYETGKGRVVLRGKAEISGNVINITSLPYQVYAEPFITQVKDLVNEDKLSGIIDICNKSDDSGMLIEIQCSGNKIDAGIVLKNLYKLTDLQVTFNGNQMAISGNSPKLFTLVDYIKAYVDHNSNCITREYQFELNKAKVREEVVSGLLKALADIDTVIDIIKKSKSAEAAGTALKKKYSFSDAQVKAIIDMKLGRLANLERVELEDEEKALTSNINSCTTFLSSPNNAKKEVVNRLTKFSDKYGWDRRTEVINLDLNEEKTELKKANKKSTDDVMVILTGNNELKKVTLGDYSSRVKTKDEIITSVKVPNDGSVILVSEDGIMYRVSVKKISRCKMNSSGMPIETLNGDKVKWLFTGNEEEDYMVLVSDDNRIKKISYQTIKDIRKKGGTQITGTSGKVILCELDDDGYEHRFSVTNSKGKTKTEVVNISDVKEIIKRSSSGVKMLSLRAGDTFSVVN